MLRKSNLTRIITLAIAACTTSAALATDDSAMGWNIKPHIRTALFLNSSCPDAKGRSHEAIWSTYSNAVTIPVAQLEQSTMTTTTTTESDAVTTDDAPPAVTVSPVGECTPDGRRPVALVLGGGGIRGAAHIGVLRVLEQQHIPIASITGSSMGAIVGGLYAAGVPLDRIQEMVTNQELQHAFAPGNVPMHVVMHVIAKARFLVMHRPYVGLYDNKHFLQFLHENLPAGGQTFEACKIPFCAVATDLNTGDPVALTTGDLATGIVASSSFPPIMKPTDNGKDLLADGSIVNNVPVEIARTIFHPSLVLAVPVDRETQPINPRTFTHLRNMVDRVASIAAKENDRVHILKADLVIQPDVSGVHVFSKKLPEILKAIHAGEAAAMEALPRIQVAVTGTSASTSL